MARSPLRKTNHLSKSDVAAVFKVVIMKKSCRDDCATSCETSQKDVPCSRNCACYLTQTVADLKVNISTRCDALKKFEACPEWSVNLTESECCLLQRDGARVVDSAARGIVARELTSRQSDLADLAGRWSCLGDDFDQCGPLLRSRLAETKAALESAAPPCHEEEDPEVTKAKAEAEKLLERSRVRICRMREALDGCVAECDPAEASCELAKCEDRRLNRAALKSALRALTSLVSDVAATPGCCDDEDDEDDCRCE